MKSWRIPAIPRVPGTGAAPHLFDTAMGMRADSRSGDRATLYVCGITPYDATHLGHANTFLAFDTLVRAWRDAGLAVTYVQNVTDVDDPLLERAARDGIDWRSLAAAQTERFRADMELLGVVPPDFYVAVSEAVDTIGAAIGELRDRGIAYPVGSDWYFASSAAEAQTSWRLGEESNYDRATMLALAAERGGDPDRVGKRDPLDPLLWRGARSGEPSWESPVGPGRPGWHIECAVIAHDLLPLPITVQGGGRDLVFPHHEFSAGHATALSLEPLAGIYAHAGFVGYRGEKMSKSLGNLVLVEAVLDAGADPRALRLALLAHHYRADWEWTDADLALATARLERWSAWASTARPGTDGLEGLRANIADDLDTPAAIAAVDARVAAGHAAPEGLLAGIDALLGIRLV